MTNLGYKPRAHVQAVDVRGLIALNNSLYKRLWGKPADDLQLPQLRIGTFLLDCATVGTHTPLTVHASLLFPSLPLTDQVPVDTNQ